MKSYSRRRDVTGMAASFSYFELGELLEIQPDLPSGKRLHNYGKSPLLMGKCTINGPFSIAMFVYQTVVTVLHQDGG